MDDRLEGLANISVQTQFETSSTLTIGINPNFDYKKVQSVLEAGGSIYFYLMADSRVFFSDKRKIVLEDITGGKGEQINKMAPGGSFTIGESGYLHITYDTPLTRNDQTEALRASTKVTIKKFLKDHKIGFK